MTQYVRTPGFRLRHSPTSTKVLISGFMLLVLGGMAVATLQYANRAGLSESGTISWIHGNAETDLDALYEIREAKTTTELLAITHDHILSLAMICFVTLHLLSLCPAREATKTCFYLVGYGSVVGMLAGPWLMASLSPGFQLLVRASGVLFVLTIVLAASWCLFELWFSAHWCARSARAATHEASDKCPLGHGSPAS